MERLNGCSISAALELFMPVLDLDTLAPPPVKTLTIEGVSYDAVETTLEQYIARVKRSKDMDTSQDAVATLENSLTLISEIFPDVPREKLEKLTLLKLRAVIDFALAPPEEIATAVAARQDQSADPNAT